MNLKRRSLLAIALLAATTGVAIVLSFQWLVPPPATIEIAKPAAPEQVAQYAIAPFPEFDAAEIERSLSEICAEADNDSADDIRSQKEKLKEFKDRMRLVRERLIVSTDAEHLHLAAVLEEDPGSRIQLLKRAVLRSPTSSHLIWYAVQACAEALDSTDCPMDAWETRLLEIDGQNSEAWIRVAANRYLAGNVDAAFRAMQRAASSAETRGYWTESIEIIERGFAAGSDYAFSERVGAAFGLAGSKLTHYGAYLNMCKAQSTIKTEWAYVCLAYGELLEKQGKTDMGQSIARSIQSFALEALGEDEGVAAIVIRQQEIRRKRAESASSFNSIGQKLVGSNPTIFSGYLAAVRTHGEIAAQAYLRQETDLWLSQQPDLYCNL